MKKFLTVFVLSLLACTAFFVGCKPNNEGNEPKTYTITYDLAGGKIEGEYKTSYTAEDSFTLPVPVKENYEFVCWTDANGKEWKEIKNQVGDKNFFASWRSMVFSITYDLAGGVNSPDNPDSYSSEGETITLSAPTREGYKFLGWSDKNAVGGDFVTEITAGSTGDKILVAVWERTSFSITYDLADGTNHPDNPDSYSSEGETITLSAPTREGYKFLGWRDKNAVGGDFVTEITAGSTGDKSLVAVWERTSFSITYDLADGTNHPDNPDSYESDSADIEIKAPTKEGYTFLGWIDAATSGTTFVDKIPAGSKGDRTFVAKWQKEVPPEVETFVVKYELVYNGQRSTVENAADVPDAEIKDGEAFNGLLPEAVPENPLYRFDGWVVITAEGEIKITAGTLADETLLGEDGETITLVAKVVRYAYAIKYVLEYDGITSTVGGHDTVESGLIAEGGTFEGKLFTFVPNDVHYKAASWVVVINGKETEITAATAFSAELFGEDGETVRLYAKAERYKYDVKYELNYGGVASTVNGATALEDGIIEIGESFADKLFTFVPTTGDYVAESWVVLINGQEVKLNSASVLTAEMLEADGSTVRLYAKAVYREVAIVYNLTDTIQREYHSNNKGTFIDYMKYGKPLTVDGGKTTVSEQTMRNGESFAGKLPAIDQKYCGWVYMTTEGYVYCSEKTVLDLSKAVIENGKLVLYACITDYWLGPY